MNLPLERFAFTGGAALMFAALSQAQISFHPAITIPTGARPGSVAVGDFNGDGHRDLAVTTGATGGVDQIEIYLNNGAGGFVAGQVLLLGTNAGASGIVARDFDGDGDIDLAVALHSQNSVRMYLNAGNGTFSAGSTAAVGVDPRRIAAGDFNGDGNIDVVTGNRNGNSISIVLNNGGTWGAVNTVAAGEDVRGVTVGDFNGNGLDDIAAAAHDDRNVNVFFSLGGGAVSAPISLSVGGTLRPSGLTAADLDGDGDIDIAAATDDNDPSLATVFLNLGGGNFGGATTYFMGGLSPGAIVAADFDLDGDNDLATANDDSGNVSTIQNAGNGSFFGPATFAAGAGTDDLQAADLDGNGSPDIVAVNSDANSLSVLLNTLADGGAGDNYCIGAPNSAGPGAVMGSTGSTSIGANGFTLTASGVIAGQPALFFYGATQTQAPFGNGFRCVANPVFRLNPSAPADGTGTAARHLDFTAPPANAGAGQIAAGSTWNFQCWYRDPAAGGSNFNLSDGLNVTFLP